MENKIPHRTIFPCGMILGKSQKSSYAGIIRIRLKGSVKLSQPFGTPDLYVLFGDLIIAPVFLFVNSKIYFVCFSINGWIRGDSSNSSASAFGIA